MWQQNLQLEALQAIFVQGSAINLQILSDEVDGDTGNNQSLTTTITSHEYTEQEDDYDDQLSAEEEAELDALTVEDYWDKRTINRTQDYNDEYDASNETFHEEIHKRISASAIRSLVGGWRDTKCKV